MQFLRHTSHTSSIQKPLVMSGYSFGFWTAQLWNISITVEMPAGQCYPRFSLEKKLSLEIRSYDHIYSENAVRFTILLETCKVHFKICYHFKHSVSQIK